MFTPSSKKPTQYTPPKKKLHIPLDITGHELDRDTKIQLKSLNSENSTQVAKYLVMSQKYLQENKPELAYEYAQTAAQSASRIPAVREACAIAAYLKEDYQKALQEFRAARRMTASIKYNLHIAECELHLQRPEKTLETINITPLEQLHKPLKVYAKIIAAKAHLLLEQPKLALQTIESLQIDPNLAFSYSPTLFTTYANILTANNNNTEAAKWEQLAKKAKTALKQLAEKQQTTENKHQQPPQKNLLELHPNLLVTPKKNKQIKQ